MPTQERRSRGRRSQDRPRTTYIDDPEIPRTRPDVDADILRRARIGPTPAQLEHLNARSSPEDADWEIDPEPVEVGQRHAKQILYLLSRARVYRSLTQTVVGQRLGRAQSAIARLERGSTDPKLSTIAAYAAALDMRLEIVDRDGNALWPGDPRLNPAVESQEAGLAAASAGAYSQMRTHG